MITEVALLLGFVGGGLGYHMLIVPRLAKACQSSIKDAEDSLANTVGIRNDLAEIQQALEGELNSCRVMRQEMRKHIEDAEELSRVTGILSYAWPAEADVVIFSRTSGCCRGVDSTGTAPLINLQDLFAKIPDLAAYTQELRAGVRSAPENTGGTTAKDKDNQAS